MVSDPKLWIVIEVTGDAEEGLEPRFDVFPLAIEFYGDFKVVAQWRENDCLRCRYSCRCNGIGETGAETA